MDVPGRAIAVFLALVAVAALGSQMGFLSVGGVTRTLVAEIDNGQTTPEHPWWVAQLSLSPGESQSFIIRAQPAQISGYNITPGKELRVDVQAAQPYCVYTLRTEGSGADAGITSTRYSMSGTPQNKYDINFLFNGANPLTLDAAKLEGQMNVEDGLVKVKTDGFHTGSSSCPGVDSSIVVYKINYQDKNTWLFVKQTTPGFLEPNGMLSRFYAQCMAQEFVFFGDEYYKRFFDSDLLACLRSKASVVGAAQFDGVTIDYPKSTGNQLYVLGTGFGPAQGWIYANAEVFDTVIVAVPRLVPVELTCPPKEIKANAVNNIAIQLRNPNNVSVSASVTGLGRTQVVALGTKETKAITFSVNKPSGAFTEVVRTCVSDFGSTKCSQCVLALDSDKDNSAANENGNEISGDLLDWLIYVVIGMAVIMVLAAGYVFLNR